MTSAATKPHQLSLAREFSCTPETLFQCFTDGEHLIRWFAPTPNHETQFAEADPREGGRYRIGILDRGTGALHIVSGTYREFVPGKRLVFSWAWEAPTDHPGNTLVTVEFQPTAAGTRLVLVHERFPSEEMKDSHEKGWSGCLANLATLE
ncbi:MAG: SRPBCC domain-containing protein [Pirellulales bacterium]